MPELRKKTIIKPENKIKKEAKEQQIVVNINPQITQSQNKLVEQGKETKDIRKKETRVALFKISAMFEVIYIVFLLFDSLTVLILPSPLLTIFIREL